MNQPVLFSPEPDIVDALLLLPGGDKHADSLIESFSVTRALLDAILTHDPAGVHQGGYLLSTLVYRAHQFACGAMVAALSDNRFSWVANLRALLETFGAIAFVAEKHDRLLALDSGHGVSIGRIMDAAARKMQTMKADYADLSALLHPTSRSFEMALSALDNERRFAGFEFPRRPPSANALLHAGETVSVLFSLILLEVDSLVASNPALLKSGAKKGVSPYSGPPSGLPKP